MLPFFTKKLFLLEHFYVKHWIELLLKIRAEELLMFVICKKMLETESLQQSRYCQRKKSHWLTFENKPCVSSGCSQRKIMLPGFESNRTSKILVANSGEFCYLLLILQPDEWLWKPFLFCRSLKQQEIFLRKKVIAENAAQWSLPTWKHVHRFWSIWDVKVLQSAERKRGYLSKAVL